MVHNPEDPVSGFQGIPRSMTGMASILRDAGYKTHMTGKWDAGMATPDHTPSGRGYDSFYGYFQHANHYWNKEGHIEATGDVDLCLNRFTDLFKENATYRGGVLDSGDLDDSCSGSDEEDPECYEEHLFKRNTLSVIEEHDPSDPLFMFHSFHLLHTPLHVPNSYLQKVDDLIVPEAFDTAGRRNYSAMVHYMDDVVGEVVTALKDKGMYEDTIIAFMSDNGGPVYLPGSANNHPLKGGKYSDWEGGVRTNAFISGGYVPEDVRGTKYDGLVSIADWYGAFSELAGVDDFKDMKAEKAGLPPVDSVSGLIGTILSGNQTNLHPVLPISELAIIQYPYKLVRGSQPHSNWTGPVFPNCSTLSGDLVPWFNDSKLFESNLDWSHKPKELAMHLWQEDCGSIGCLFNLEDDPNETNDLAVALPGKVEELGALLDEFGETLFIPDRGTESADACGSLAERGGYYGPFVDADDYYTGPYRELSLKQRAFEKLYVEFLEVISKPKIEDAIIWFNKLIYPRVMRDRLIAIFDYCLPQK